jgi:transposase InsO family protein
MDLHSRKIIGYAYDTCITAKLAVKAVDNTCIESFHSLLKKDEVNHQKYPDFNTARKAVFEYIESWYNRKRIHSVIS